MVAAINEALSLGVCYGICFLWKVEYCTVGSSELRVQLLLGANQIAPGCPHHWFYHGAWLGMGLPLTGEAIMVRGDFSPILCGFA